MPYDFIKMVPYTVDYSNLEYELHSLKPFLKNLSWNKKYIDDWIARLKKSESLTLTQMSSKEERQHYLLARLEEPEVFQSTIYIGSNTFLLHFRISPLRQLLSEAPEVPTESIPISEFVNSTSILWNKETGLGCRPLSEPIIAIPYPVGDYRLLVVDGNHRLSMHIETNSSDISVCCVSGNTLINYSLFASPFDKYFYAMFIELRGAKMSADSGESDNDILNKSMLYNPDNKFNYML